ncbi:hypothetical protein BKA82DRAFT_2443872 [Pisolithus tinctorius]|nr:hypothetical protein BKA82DRAFT_2443872 [Pisolithus tinctorius]
MAGPSCGRFCACLWVSPRVRAYGPGLPSLFPCLGADHGTHKWLTIREVQKLNGSQREAGMAAWPIENCRGAMPV